MSAIPTSRATRSRRRIATPVTRPPRRGWHGEFETERDKARFRPGIGNGGPTGEVVRSRRFTERLELGIGGKPFLDVFRAAARRQPEQAHRLVLRIEPQVVGLGVFGIEPDRLAQVSNGAVEIALAFVRERPLVVGDGGIFRTFAAALDDAGAGGDAAIRIVPLASVPVGSARGRGRGCEGEQRGGPNQHTQYAHDPLPCLHTITLSRKNAAGRYNSRYNRGTRDRIRGRSERRNRDQRPTRERR